MSSHGPNIGTDHGQHVMVSAKLDTETDQTYGVRLARVGSHSHATTTLARNGNGVSNIRLVSAN